MWDLLWISIFSTYDNNGLFEYLSSRCHFGIQTRYEIKVALHYGRSWEMESTENLDQTWILVWYMKCDHRNKRDSKFFRTHELSCHESIKMSYQIEWIEKYTFWIFKFVNSTYKNVKMKVFIILPFRIKSLDFVSIEFHSEKGMDYPQSCRLLNFIRIYQDTSGERFHCFRNPAPLIRVGSRHSN